MGGQEDRRPFRRDGFDSRSGRDLGGFPLEDAELGGLGGLIGLFAQGALGKARASLAGGDKLTGEFDEVGRDIDGSAEVFEDWRLAEGDLVIKGEALGFVEGTLRLEPVCGLREAGGDLVYLVQPDGETEFGGLPQVRGLSFAGLRLNDGSVWVSQSRRRRS